MAVRTPHWVPFLERAGFEMRLRDVGTADRPLVGVVARIASGGQQGNHPGPLSFYLMWPTYRLVGASAWAMQAAVVSMHLAAVGIALWLGSRRGGRRLVLGLALAVTLVARGVGMSVLVDPWNPFLSLLWFLAFLVAVWSVVDGDLAGLPVAVLAGSVCAQGHVEYVPLVAAAGAAVGGVLAVRWVRAVRGPAWPAARGDRLRVPVWSAATAALGAVLWLPPILDELASTPGNLAIIRGQFTAGEAPAIGVEAGTRAVLVNLDPTRLVRQDVVGWFQVTGSIVPGVLLLAVWALAAAGAVWAGRRRPGDRRLVRLHAVLAGTFVFGCLGMSRITGAVWFWLGLWGAVLCALVLVAIGWSVGAFVAARDGGTDGIDTVDAVDAPPVDPAGRQAWWQRLRAVPALAALLAVVAAVLTVEATGATTGGEELSGDLARLVPDTSAALASGEVAGGGRDGRYLVTFTDPLTLGMHAFGLVDELERDGFDVGMLPAYRASVADHRVVEPTGATAVVHLSVGPTSPSGGRCRVRSRSPTSTAAPRPSATATTACTGGWRPAWPTPGWRPWSRSSTSSSSTSR